jgi:hypothetical protein
MFDDSRLHAEVRSELLSVTVPRIDLVEIRRRMNAQGERPSGTSSVLRIAAAAAVVVILGLFAVERSPALVQSLEDRYHAMLVAVGIEHGVPMPIPDSLVDSIHQSLVALTEARRRANFTVIAPAGLPHDVVGRHIFIAPLAVWTKQTDAWSFDGVQVSFVYVRKDGRSFDIIADRYSPFNGPTPRYMYVVDGVSANGRPIVKERDENFVWRNGDQELRTHASSTLSAREIGQILAAMHGVLLPRANGTRPIQASDRVVFYSTPGH